MADIAVHGGAFWDAIGADFGDLRRADEIINADVLDAWFPPDPAIVARLTEHLDWLMRTSPPTRCEGLLAAISETRGVLPACVTAGPGSSSLIFAAFRQWFSGVRALALRPTYGEYAHVLNHVVGSKVDAFDLHREEGYRVDIEALARAAAGYDLLVLVNPNSPTGGFLPRTEVVKLLDLLPETVTVWIDETYLEYAGSPNGWSAESLETEVARRPNLMVLKSMSKVYALSGLRIGYLIAPAERTAELQRQTPPWAVDLPAQVAAIMALRDSEYYPARWRETATLRNQMVEHLVGLGWEVAPSSSNFVLADVRTSNLETDRIAQAMMERGIFVRAFPEGQEELRRYGLRLAVKDAATQSRLVSVLTEVVNSPKG